MSVDHNGAKRKSGAVTDSAEKQQHVKAFREDPLSPGEAGGSEEEQQEEPLTDTLKLGMLGMQTQQEAIIHQIDELMAVGSSFLDNLKEQFLRRMEKVKEELRGFCDGQASIWGQTSLETLEAQERLQNAQLLVHRLGLKAAHEAPESDAAEPTAAV